MTRTLTPGEQRMLTDAAEANDLRVRLDYSGRGMYGATCVGVTGASSAIDAFLADVGDQFAGDLRAILAQPSRDSMGLGVIAYWPSLQSVRQAFGVRIPVEGDVVAVPVDRYEDIRDAVEGWIEAAPVNSDDLALWINEEGKLNGMPVNPRADALWAQVFPTTDRIPGDVLVGPALVTGIDDDGETTTAPAWVFAKFGLEVPA